MHNLLNVGFVGILGKEETEYASMYESRSKLTTVQGQHFVEWFTGKSLPSYWHLHDQTSTGCEFNMSDSINGGLIATSDSSSTGAINFNLKRQYEPNGSVLIAVFKHGANNYDGGIGLSNTLRGMGATDHTSAHMLNGDTYTQLQSGGSSLAETATTHQNDLLEHVMKLELKTSSSDLSMDGVVVGTESRAAYRPTVKLMPQISHSSSNGSGTLHIRYLECYNT